MRLTALTFGLIATFLPASFAGTPAPTSTNNPPGVQYIAVLPSNGPASGSVVASSTPSGNGVDIQVSISGLPSQGGPFLYFINVNPVNASGNCSSTCGVLDPYDAGTAIPCNSSMQDKCRIGDLSGKHGAMQPPNFAANYVDQYLSTIVGSPAFVGNRSLVIEYANKTFLTCANFSMNGLSSSSAGPVSTSAPVTSVANALPMSGGRHESIVSSATTTTASLAMLSNGWPCSSNSSMTAPAARPLFSTDKGTVFPQPSIASSSTSAIVPTAAAPQPAVQVATSPLQSTPGVVPNFTPGLNGPASTITTSVNNTVTVKGPAHTVTKSSNNTVTVTVLILPQPQTVQQPPKTVTHPQNTTRLASPLMPSVPSSNCSTATKASIAIAVPATNTPSLPSSECGNVTMTTLPNGRVVTLMLGTIGSTSNGSQSSSTTSQPSTTCGCDIVTTLSGGPSGITTTIGTSVITICPKKKTVITIPASASSSSSLSVITTTLPNSHTLVPGVSIVTLTIVTNPMGGSMQTLTSSQSGPSNRKVVTITTSTPAETLVSMSTGIVSVVEVITDTSFTSTSAGVVTTTVPVTITQPASTFTIISTRPGLFESMTSRLFGGPLTSLSTVTEISTVDGFRSTMMEIETLVYPKSPTTSLETLVQETTIEGQMTSVLTTIADVSPEPSTITSSLPKLGLITIKGKRSTLKPFPKPEPPPCQPPPKCKALKPKPKPPKPKVKPPKPPKKPIADDNGRNAHITMPMYLLNTS